MGFLQLIPVVAIVILICIEAAHLDTRASSDETPRRFPRWFPLLLVSVAILALLFSLSAVWGWLVVSPELGLIMIEGRAVGFAGIVVLTLSSVCFGLLVPAVGAAVGRPGHAAWSLAGSGVATILVVAGIQTLNPSARPALSVVTYDLWSPPLVLWLSLCLLDSALRVFRVQHARLRVYAHLLMVAAVASVAMERYEFLLPIEKTLWRFIGLGALTLSIGVLPAWLWLVLRRLPVLTRPPLRVVVVTGVWCAASIAGWWKLPATYQRWTMWTLWAVAVIAVVGAIRWEEARPDGARPTFRLHRWQALMLLAHVAMAITLFSLQVFDHTIVTVGMLTAWVVLAESTGAGALASYGRRLRAASAGVQGSLVAAACRSTGARLHDSLVEARNTAFRLFAGGTIVGTIAKALVAVMLLIALSEIPNAGTTIIGSFTVDSSAKDKDKDLGQAVANNLVYALHRLNEKLRPDAALVNSAAGRDRGFRFVAAKDDATSLDSELAKRPEVDLGPLKVPFSVLTAPIKGPTRQLLGVRVISGAVHDNGPQKVVLARSTSGEAWKVPMDSDSARTSVTPSDADVGRHLAHQLALQIVTSDRSSGTAGLTQSGDAMDAFEKGWQAWRHFEIDQDLRALDQAITHFREATMSDWRFALAHYRLARALQKANRPGAATEAFRASLQTNTGFAPGLIALASILYDYDSYSPSWPAAARIVPPSQTQGLASLFRKNEAARLWQQVLGAPAGKVSSTDRAAAHAGLCLRAYDVGLSLDGVKSTLDTVREKFAKFNATEAFRAWAEATKSRRELDLAQREGKTVGDRERARQEQLEDEWRRTFEPFNLAQTDASKALTELDALGADDARTSLDQAVKMFEWFGDQPPTSEEDAEAKKAIALEHLDRAEKQRRRQVPIQSLLTYFYCKRADKIYSSLVDARADRDFSAGASRVAYLLGLTLERRHDQESKPQEPKWRCGTWATPSRGAYSRAALRQYDRAAVLAPDDAVVRCQAALTAYQLDDSGRLRALDRDSAARLSLAEQHFKNARETSGDKTVQSYRSALAEYASAIDRNPNSADALNGYAYTFWTWHYAWLQKVPGVIEPDENVRRLAEQHARQASWLVAGNRTKKDEILISSTLGEVLLGLGRFEEAHKVLDELLQDPSVLEHAAYNEMRWDLAQACLCVARNPGGSNVHRPTEALKKRADDLLKQVKAIELKQERRPLSSIIDKAVCPEP